MATMAALHTGVAPYMDCMGRAASGSRSMIWIRVLPPPLGYVPTKPDSEIRAVRIWKTLLRAHIGVK